MYGIIASMQPKLTFFLNLNIILLVTVFASIRARYAAGNLYISLYPGLSTFATFNEEIV